jgi:hypothetical protein
MLLLYIDAQGRQSAKLFLLSLELGASVPPHPLVPGGQFQRGGHTLCYSLYVRTNRCKRIVSRECSSSRRGPVLKVKPKPAKQQAAALTT